MLRCLQSWIDQLRWQRLKPMEELARMLLNHLEGLLNYCRIKVPLAKGCCKTRFFNLALESQ
jgi:hypothetical protein